MPIIEKYRIPKNKPTAFLLLLILLTVSVVAASGQQTAAGAKKVFSTPLILIHGIGGSDLRQQAGRGLLSDGGFPNDVLKFIAGDPQKIQFDSRGEPRADTISKDIAVNGFYDVPGSRNITDLSKYLRKQGYVLNVSLFEFAYDFRFSAVQNAAELGKLVARAKQKSATGQVDIVGHSMGGMVAKAFLLNPENAAFVKTLIFVGTPHLGAPKALKALRYGDDLDVRIIDGCKLKRAVHNLPGMFNLLPGKKYFDNRRYFIDDDDLDGDAVRGLLDYEQTLFNLKNGKETKCLLKPDVDIAPMDKSLPSDRLNGDLIERHTVEFHRALDDWTKPPNVKVFNIVGYGVSTLETIKESGGRVSFGYTNEGDGTVPLWSAEAAASDDIYYVNLGKLKLEHASMIGDARLARQIYETLTEGAGAYIPEAAPNRPSAAQFTKKQPAAK